jgi:formylglycine-generating enzyme required for sulfatase activity
MKRTIVFALIVFGMAMANSALADTFGTGANQFAIDFIPISGDASSANGTNISQYSSGETGYKTFTDPGNFRIGKFEITNNQWNKFTAAYGTVTGSPPYAYDENPLWTGTNQPINEVSRYGAAQFVNWLNTSTNHAPAYKFTGTQGTSDYTFVPWSVGDTGYNADNPFRNSQAFYVLPTEDEWVKAGYWNGTNLQTYATKAGESLYQGNGSNGGWNYIWYTLHQPWNVGSGSEELNGTFDMMGNVFEFMESPYYSGDYLFNSPHLLRGGSYYDNHENRLKSGNRMDPELTMVGDGNFNIGIRVASIPEPATLMILTLGGMTLIRRQKRKNKAK